MLDPFFGAGTVGLVAERHGRDWVGLEINPAYAKLAERRLAEAKPDHAEPDGGPVGGTQEAHYAGALPLDLLKSEQERLASELNYVEERLGVLELKFDTVERNLKAALKYAGNLHTAYNEANHRIRRQINQAIFKRLLISSDGDIIAELRPPFNLLLQASGTADQNGVIRPQAKEKPRGPRGPHGLSKHDLVGERGLEPPNLAAQPPQGCVFTNFTTRPKNAYILYSNRGKKTISLLLGIVRFYNRLKKEFIDGHILDPTSHRWDLSFDWSTSDKPVSAGRSFKIGQSQKKCQRARAAVHYSAC